MAGVLKDLKEYEESKNMYLRALEIKKKNLGENHKENSITLANLAGVLVSLGDLGGAKENYK